MYLLNWHHSWATEISQVPWAGKNTAHQFIFLAYSYIPHPHIYQPTHRKAKQSYHYNMSVNRVARWYNRNYRRVQWNELAKSWSEMWRVFSQWLDIATCQVSIITDQWIYICLNRSLKVRKCIHLGCTSNTTRAKCAGDIWLIPQSTLLFTSSSSHPTILRTYIPTSYINVILPSFCS
jgi:hypothetical protein